MWSATDYTRIIRFPGYGDRHCPCSEHTYKIHIRICQPRIIMAPINYYIAERAVGDDRHVPTHIALIQPRPQATLQLDTVRTPRPNPVSFPFGHSTRSHRLLGSRPHQGRCFRHERMYPRSVSDCQLTALQPFDYKILRHAILAKEWPWIGGTDVAGTVVALGAGVENLKLDDRIISATVHFVEGYVPHLSFMLLYSPRPSRNVAAWQEYAIVRSDLCTKVRFHILATHSFPHPSLIQIPDNISFPAAASIPTAFLTASLALALDLGLKYPAPPPPAQPKSAASIWAKALASIGGGNSADIELNLQDGIIEGGSWYPGGKTLYGFTSYSVHGPEPAPAPPKSKPIASSEPVQSREERTRRQALAREFAKENGEDYDQLWGGPELTYPKLTSADFPSASRPRSAPVNLGTGDLSREAMDRMWGSGWEDPTGPQPIELVEDHITPAPRGLALVRGGGGSSGTSASGSGSASTGMDRTGSDESYTSVEGMSVSLPSLGGGSARSILGGIAGGISGRRGSGSLLGLDRGLGLGLGSSSGSTHGRLTGSGTHAPHIARSGARTSGGGGSQLPPVGVGHAFASRPSANRPTQPPPQPARSGHTPTPGSRGSTSPFRVPATLSHRGRGSQPYACNARDRSPLEELSIVKQVDGEGDGKGRKREADNEPSSLIRPPPGSLGGISWPPNGVGRYPFASGVTLPSSGLYPPRPEMSELEASVFCARPLTPPELPAYVMDEPILVWGGGTCIGRNALQLLKRAGYTCVIVVCAKERWEELGKIVPEGTR